jgi:6-phosphogluconate dehydrogenase
MQLGMIGLGRMGANMVRRLLRGGHQCVVFDRSPKAVAELAAEKAMRASSPEDLLKKLAKPRAVCLMVPAAVVDKTIAKVLPSLEPGDIRRAKDLAQRRVHYVWEPAEESGGWSAATA